MIHHISESINRQTLLEWYIIYQTSLIDKLTTWMIYHISDIINRQILLGWDHISENTYSQTLLKSYIIYHCAISSTTQMNYDISECKTLPKWNILSVNSCQMLKCYFTENDWYCY
jgi:hypothetical protein